jgi:hypothetical protein
MAIAVMSIAVMATTPAARVARSQPTPSVTRDVRLTAMAVPPGGLVTSFLGNQVVYCTLICPLLIETGVTPIVTTLAAPGTFLTAFQSGDLLKAIGATAASVTGPTNAAAQQAILVDGEIPAQRALNAFEVGVIGLLNIPPAATGGLPAILAAIQTARQDTFTALNLPIMPNPTPTVMPRGALQVAVLGVINVGAAVIFPGFNDILSGVFQTPDAIAQELAATGSPIRALAAGVNTAATAVTAAGTVIADSVVTALGNIPAPAVTPGPPRLGILTNAPGILATVAQQAIRVAISLAVGGAVGAPIVLAGVVPAVQNFLADGNGGALLGAATAAELKGFGTAVGVVADAVGTAGTAIAAALHNPPAATLSPATTSVATVARIGKPSGNVMQDLERTRSMGKHTRPLAQQHMPTPAKAAAPKAIKAGGNDHKRRGGDSARGRSNRSSHR